MPTRNRGGPPPLPESVLKATLETYKACDYNQIRAAQHLGMSRSGFQSRLRKALALFQPEVPPFDAEIIAPEYVKPIIRVQLSYDKLGDYSVLVIGDAHDSPRIPKDRFYWMGRYAREHNKTHIIQMGDMLTFDSLCRYEGNDTLNGKSKPAFMDDILSGRDALQAFDDGLGDFAPDLKHCVLGNHEDRAISFTNRVPEMDGMLLGQIDNLFMTHRWTYSPFKTFYFLGGVGFTHAPIGGTGKPIGGKTAASRIANEALHDLCFAHTHCPFVHRAPKLGNNQWVTIINAGCALPEGHVENYAKHSQTGWGYGIFDVKISDGRITGHNFVTMRELEASYGSP